MGRSIIKTIVLGMGLVWFCGSSWAQQANPLPETLKTVTQDIIGGQINAFKAKDHDRAFGYAAPGIRQMFGTTDQFIKMVRSGYSAIYGAQNWSFGRGEIKDDIVVQEVLLTGPAGRDWVALYTLRKQDDGSWRIAGVQILPGAAQNT